MSVNFPAVIPERKCLVRVRRRYFAIGVGTFLAASFGAAAQRAPKVARIGYLAANLPANLHLQEAFLQGLVDLGYVEGRNLAMEY